MSSCTKCGGELKQQDFNYCPGLEFCPRCEPTKFVRSKIYLNGKEVEYCVEVNTATGKSTIVSTTEEA
jgi:hypothetical protein